MLQISGLGYVMIYIYIIFIKDYLQQEALIGGQEKRKDRKTQKSRNEEKVEGFSSASLFPARKWEALTQGGITGIGSCGE